MSLLSFFKKPATQESKAHNIPQSDFRAPEKVQAEVLDIAVHQLKTPLVGMKWSMKMLIDGEMGPLNNEQKTIIMYRPIMQSQDNGPRPMEQR
jgi:hypothetical protein